MISTIAGFITRIHQVYQEWDSPHYVWFRGEPVSDTPLLPKLYRPKADGKKHHENKLLQMFRMRAPPFAKEVTPDRSSIDQWLFLAQHVGLPTRLLDWTENALLALYFALKTDHPIVWMLDPMRLNELSISGENRESAIEIEEFPLTWLRPSEPKINIGHENIRGAWENDNRGVDLPVAVHPTHIHERMSAQRSVFTVHGRKKQPLCELVPTRILAKFEIQTRARDNLNDNLRMLGFQESSAFPDLDGLTKELANLY